ncbi:MDR family MFS transporter [Microbispora sp. ATCC PTA-5024]|uniref:MDR family MFS transporter n=1 Tax=Microbispora sp. ATCC PTA-5024 TaxID=316330 RepID=UPI00055C56CD|nr:MDR family MFS transporter [Microbispora sp. ATCC PTA-5024]
MKSSNGLLLLAVLGGMFLAMLDQTIVGTALPRITAELGGSGLYTWVVTAYLLTSTVTVPLYGRLSDVHGRKPLLLIGVVVFLAGSALSGAAQDMGQLIAFRGLQGLGAGALLPLSLALVIDLFPPERSGRVQGALGGVMGLSYIAGPFLGGLFTDHASWRWAFYVNVPIGVALVAIIWLRLPHRRGEEGGDGRAARPDYLGIAVFSAAVSALLVGLTEKGLDGHTWTSGPVLGPIAAALVLLAVFVAVERRAGQPIVPLHLFANRTYTLVNVASFFTAFCMYAGVVFLPRYFQEAHGLSATSSGLHIYPLMLAMVAGSVITGALISRTGRYKPWLVAAPFLLVAGTLLCAGLGVGTATLTLTLWMALIGLGMGPMLSGLTVAIQSSVPPRYVGTASANLTFFRQIGGSVALATAGTAYGAVVSREAPLHGLPAAHAAATATVIPWLGVVGAAVALVALALLPSGRAPLRRPAAEPDLITA